jgi:Disulphide bond corrector protein DsbC
MRPSMRTASLTLTLVLAGAACGKTEAPQPAPAAPSASPAQPAAPAAPAEKKPVIEEPTFRLGLSGEPTYTAGQPGKLKLALSARGGYHVNQDYPIRVDVKGPAGVTFSKASLGRPDAASWGESDASFELAFTGQPGTHEIIADVDFAVCTAETCVPDQRTLALSVDVK